jgi:predicted ribosome quality control (RQC) complex YloA/Tae2 family protein
MPEAIKILEVKSPHFTIKLSDDLLKIDLKGSFKNEVEEALEHKPVLKESIGRILGIFVPLHIHVSEIDSVHMDETGKITVNLHHHRNVVIPLEHKENAEKLVEKLNQLISKARTEKIRENAEEKRAEKKLKRAHAEAKRKENERINAQRAHEIHEEKVFG